MARESVLGVRPRCLPAFALLALALLPAPAHAGTLLAQWHLDSQASTPATDCAVPEPDSQNVPNPCAYYKTPDAVNGFDVGPYYHSPMTLAQGRYGEGLAATNTHMPQRQSSSGVPQPPELTVMAWVRHSGYPGSIQYIVGEGDDGSACSKASWALYTASSGVAFYISPYNQSPVLSPAMTAQESASLWDGSWHMVAGTYDQSTVRLYVDGREIGHGTATPFPTVDYYTLQHANLYMDGYYPAECAGGNVGYSHDFTGDLDEVRLYRRALTATELARMQSDGLSQVPVLVPDPPVVHTTGADQVTNSGARVNGTIDDHGSFNNAGDPVSYHVEYGTTTAYGHSSSTLNSDGQGLQTVHVALSGLSPGTTYHARLVAGASNTAGEDVTFTTSSPPTLSFTSSTLTVGEGAGQATLTVQRSGDASQVVSAHYSTSDVTAQGGSDYGTVVSTVTLAAGETTKNVSIPITDDTVHESEETFAVDLSNPSGATLASPAQATVHITDNDALPTASIGLDPPSPGASGSYTTPVKVTVTGSGHAPVETRCVLDPAQAPAAFSDIPAGCSVSGSTVSAPGTHKVYAASRDSAGSGSVVSRSFTITNNAALRLKATTVTLAEDQGSATLTVERTGDTSTAVSVHYATSDGSAKAGSDYTSTSGTLSFSAGQTTKDVLVPIVDDPSHESIETFTFALASPSSNAVLGSPIEAQVQITDNDALPETAIALDPPTPGEGDVYSGHVTVTVIGSGHAGTDTRCVLDPAQAPATFDDMPAGCSVSGSTVAAAGPHVIYAGSRDSAGTGVLVSRSFTITAPPTPDTSIVDAPSGTVWTATSMFAFTSTVAGSTFECRVDGGDFSACSSPFESAALASGPHAFEVRAIGPDGTADPSPAAASFAVGEPTKALMSCSLSPVRFSQETASGPWGCLVGKKTFCAAMGLTCVPQEHPCPVGAECVATTTGDYSTADRGRDVKFVAAASFQSDWYQNVAYATADGSCNTGGTSDGCRASATLHVLGTGQPVLVWCQAHRGETTGPLDEHPDQRRIGCNADLEIKLAAPLATAAAGTDLQVLAPAQGTLDGTATASGTTAAGVTAAAARPRIASFHRSVRARGPLTVHLRPNKAGRRQLRRHHRLRAIVRLTFTTSGGRVQRRNAKVTLTAHAQKKCPLRHGKRTRCLG